MSLRREVTCVQLVITAHLGPGPNTNIRVQLDP